MKKITLLSISVASFFLTTSVFAAEKAAVKTEKPAIKTEAVKKVSDAVDLYSAPNAKAAILKKLPADANIIGIYHQGDWVKVGDRQDGSVGWINIQQYRLAKNEFYHHAFHTDVSTIFMNVSKDKNGKTVFEAYKNGKKLSDADAKKMYEDMQARQKKEWEAMQKFNQAMNQQMMDEQRAMNDLFATQPVFMPGVVIVEKPDTKK